MQQASLMQQEAVRLQVGAAFFLLACHQSLLNLSPVHRACSVSISKAQVCYGFRTQLMSLLCDVDANV